MSGENSALGAAIAIAGVALAIGQGPAFAETQNKHVVKPTPHTTQQATPHVNVRTTTHTTVHTTTHTVTQQHVNKYKKITTGPGPSPGPNGTKFHKKVGPATPTATPVSPAVLHAASPVKLKPGPGKINPAIVKPINFPVLKLANNKFAPLWKVQKKIWWGGQWKVFVPFTAIGVVVFGGTYYWPDAYVGLAGPYCAGLTPDGCRLNWQLVNFADGGSDWQCVQFCPRPGVLPPPQAVALAPPPPPQGTCQVTIFSESNFAGTGVPTSEEQPRLSESGWQNQIASIQVQSGTWDFYSEENFGGETMRLAPGPYPALTPEWTKHIGSFMCVAPGG